MQRLLKEKETSASSVREANSLQCKVDDLQRLLEEKETCMSSLELKTKEVEKYNILKEKWQMKYLMKA